MATWDVEKPPESPESQSLPNQSRPQGLLDLSPLVWFSSMPPNTTVLTDTPLLATQEQGYAVGAEQTPGNTRRSLRGTSGPLMTELQSQIWWAYIVSDPNWSEGPSRLGLAPPRRASSPFSPPRKTNRPSQRGALASRMHAAIPMVSALVSCHYPRQVWPSAQEYALGCRKTFTLQSKPVLRDSLTPSYVLFAALFPTLET